MTHEQRPSAEEARQALESITESQQALAGHVRSPVWLYPAQGVGMGLLIIGLVFSKDNEWATGIIAVTVILFSLLPTLQTRSRVVFDVYTHPASRGLALVYVVLFVLISVATLALHAHFSWAWIGYGGAVLALILTLVMGPAMDERLARALRNRS